MSYISFLNEKLNLTYQTKFDMSDFHESNCLAEGHDIFIENENNLSMIVKDKFNGGLVGALWTSWNLKEEFSFDVIVDVKYSGLGIGSTLVDKAIEKFYCESKNYKNPEIRVQVISQIMEKMLEKRNFVLEYHRFGKIIMSKK